MADDARLFWRLHEGLPRQGPGSDATTRRMLAAAAPPADATALDIACGPGRAAVVLASSGADRVVAVDLHEPFLVEGRERAAAAGVADCVEFAVADMAALPYDDASFDLLWCEGAAYILGVERALRAWRRLLRPGGRVALTECVWTTHEPGPEAQAFWRAAYPDMRHAEANVESFAAAGWTVLDWWVLPDADWWDEYYDPLSRRFDALPAAERAAAHEAVGAELALRRAHGDEYGYAAYVLAPT